MLNSQSSILKMFTPVYPLQISQTMSMSGSYILVLNAPENNKHVPVLIGEAEAQAIIMAIEQKEARRPLTHNLLKNILDEYMLTLKKVTIDRFDEGIFYSSIYISDGFSEKRIDSRTSDAVVLAIMQHCDILMDLNVLEETSMNPNALTDNLPSSAYTNPHGETLEELEQQLRVCEANEDYEQAAEIMERINQMKSNNSQ